MGLPTDAQREAWENFSKASKESAEETAGLDGVARMAERAKMMSESLEDSD